VLRALLGSYLDLEPASLGFAPVGNGKPILARQEGGAHLSFNVSHSWPLALYAFSHADAVGVDVQRTSARPVDVAAIAARLLGAQQGRRLADLGPGEREREFLRAWTRTEAALKCRGVGIWGPGGANAGQRRGVREPGVIELELGANAAGAVAADPPAFAVRCSTWAT